MQDMHTSRKGLLAGIALTALVLLSVAFFFLFTKGDVPGLTSGGADIDPFGGPVDVDSPGGGNIGGGAGSWSSGGSGAGERGKLWRITDAPVAGFHIFAASGTPSVVRYIEREKGHVFEADLSTRNVSRITNTTHPGIHDAIFGPDAASVLVRFLDYAGTIKTELYSIIPNTESDDVPSMLSGGEFLPDNIVAITPGPDHTSAIFIQRVGYDGLGKIIDLRTRGVETLFRYPFTEWIPEVGAGGVTHLTTKAAATFEGSTYRYDAGTKTFRRVLGGKLGLTTLYSPSGGKLLYSEIVSGHPLLFLHEDGAEGEAEFAHPGFVTLPEKCAWGGERIVFCGVPESIFGTLLPDGWYQGEVAFKDKLMSHDVETGEERMLIDLKEEAASVSIDVVSPAVSADAKHLLFINKIDGSLWALELGESAIPSYDENLTPEERKDAEGSI